MSTHVHRFAGCAPAPLAHYLKGLGILRLVAEQRDVSARGWWQDEAFCLATILDRDELETFFLHEYQPTPMISPWNGGSGFYAGDQQRGIRALELTTTPRYQPFREAIASGRKLVGQFPETEKGKLDLQTACRQQWRGPLLTWFDAAVVLLSDGKPKYPSLLGTGGNDGRLDFPNNYMQRLAELFGLSAEPPPAPTAGDLFQSPTAGEPLLPPTTQPLLNAALFGDASMGLVDRAIGQFLPGGAGGANSSAGFGGGSSFNPWDFVLMLEGALLFAASVVRRAEAKEAPQAAAPFATYADAIGYGTAAENEKRSRGEQWMPLWSRPATAPEIRTMIGEGRSRMTSRGASRPIDFAKAVARLGVARGITAFQRYGYLERYGQNNLAIPIGRWTVSPQPKQNLLDEVGPWIQSLARAANEDTAPNSFRSVARRCQEAELNCTRGGSDTARWQSLLLALAQAELQMLSNPQFTGKKNYLRPLSRLSPGWIEAANDNRPEFRLALALAGQHGTIQTQYGRLSRAEDAVENHWLPLEPKRRAFAVRDDKLAFDHRVVCAGHDLVADCLALLRRRLVETRQGEYPQAHGLLPMFPVPGAEVNGADLAEFLAGRVDDEKILHLALALMAVDWTKPLPLSEPSRFDEWNGLYCLFRLVFLPAPLNFGDQRFKVTPDPAILSRLAAGDLAQAADLALRRLRACGLRPTLRLAAGDKRLARRLAASLAFGISAPTASRLAYRLLKPFSDPVQTTNTAPETPEPDHDPARSVLA